MKREILIGVITFTFLITSGGFCQSGPLPLEELQKTTLYKSIEEALQNPAEVYRINVTNQNIEFIPPEIGTLHNLQYLNVSKNSIGSLPAEIKELKNLQWLVVEDNKLTILPAEVGELANLEVLDLDGNSSLDADGVFKVAAGMPSLKELSMNRVLINSIPKSFFELKNIEKLYLSNTGISEFPENMGQLYKLKVLDVSFNSITKIPGEIQDMKRLLELYLGGNRITKLPIEIQELRFTLQKISLASRSEITGDMVGNPISEEEVIKLQEWLPRTFIENVYK